MERGWWSDGKIKLLTKFRAQSKRSPDEEGEYMAFEQLMAEAAVKKSKEEEKKERKAKEEAAAKAKKEAATAHKPEPSASATSTHA